MTRPSLAPFFDPHSIAVIGASRDPSKVGGSVLANLRSAGFLGRIIPINASSAIVQGLEAYPSLLEVEEEVDLAVITVPAEGVLPALRDSVRKGVRGAVVISAGFRESADEGRRREAELREWLVGQPIRLLGPNCLGWIRPSRRLNVTFAPGMPEPGGIAFISHSGALAVAILDWARERRLGFSFFASLGNQADLNESDLLQAAAEDPETRVIAAYIEGVANGRRFVETLSAVAATKPVVLLKTGRSSEGARAVSSHTGALAGSDTAFDAAVRMAGAVRVTRVEELFDLARGNRDTKAFAREQPRQRCAQAFAGADDESGLVFRRFHRRIPCDDLYLSRRAIRQGNLLLPKQDRARFCRRLLHIWCAAWQATGRDIFAASGSRPCRRA